MRQNRLTVSQFYELQDYMRTLSDISHHFYGLEKGYSDMELAHMIADFEKADHHHSTVAAVLGEKASNERFNEFRDIVLLLEEWVEAHMGDKKNQLLSEKLMPRFEQWKTDIQVGLLPYLTH
ncbi:hypothetical protein [Halobacillus andaensis]|uniref:hypothetical protein n=1 Tax=Halobacillus andaensis TaxID=1176239 RepID=UPI003D71149C